VVLLLGFFVRQILFLDQMLDSRQAVELVLKHAMLDPKVLLIGRHADIVQLFVKLPDSLGRLFK